MRVSLDVLLSKYNNDVLDLHDFDVHVQQRLCTLFFGWLQINPLLCFWPIYSTKHNRTKSSMYTNHGYDKTHTQNPLILRRNDISFGHADQYDRNGKVSVYESRIILNSSLISTTGKTLTVKDISRPKTRKNVWKSKIYGSKKNKTKSNMNPQYTGISRLSGYIYQVSLCL